MFSFTLIYTSPTTTGALCVEKTTRETDSHDFQWHDNRHSQCVNITSVTLSTPTNGSTPFGLLMRFLGKDRGTSLPLIAIIAEPESAELMHKAVRFGGVEDEDE